MISPAVNVRVAIYRLSVVGHAIRSLVFMFIVSIARSYVMPAVSCGSCSKATKDCRILHEGLALVSKVPQQTFVHACKLAAAAAEPLTYSSVAIRCSTSYFSVE